MPVRQRRGIVDQARGRSTPRLVLEPNCRREQRMKQPDGIRAAANAGHRHIHRSVGASGPRPSVRPTADAEPGRIGVRPTAEPSRSLSSLVATQFKKLHRWRPVCDRRSQPRRRAAPELGVRSTLGACRWTPCTPCMECPPHAQQPQPRHHAARRPGWHLAGRTAWPSALLILCAPLWAACTFR